MFSGVHDIFRYLRAKLAFFNDRYLVKVGLTHINCAQLVSKFDILVASCVSWQGFGSSSNRAKSNLLPRILKGFKVFQPVNLTEAINRGSDHVCRRSI